MKAINFPSRSRKWLGVMLCALVVGSTARAQLTPIWTINHGAAVPAAPARGQFYDNLGFAGVPVVQETPTIDFNWGFGSPAPAIPVDSFSARWTASVSPTVSETYQFFVTAAGGVRIWLDDELIHDQWYEHAENEI